MRLEHRHLGGVGYDTAWALQQELRAERIEGRGHDVLLTLEHDPPVLTAGRRATPEGLRDADGMQQRTVERGGEWTYHGPGQLVGYPIVAIGGWKLRVTDFVAGLETAMATIARRSMERSGAALDGVVIGRRCGFPGAWTHGPRGAAKLGAVGVHFRRFVSMHGLALNLDPDPWGFDRIVPCGLSDEVLSVRRLIARYDGDEAAVPNVEEAAGWLAELLPQAWRGEVEVPSWDA
ncbi:MAG: lipoyl(octanoyl) transferase LipB [Proteobacteria bacterium]|nr:lipoyl(octanoyl) transferase LipB [Pseudomonadota bacterium]